MPEGDTIHRAARDIAAVLAGVVPDELRTPHPRHRADRWDARLAGRRVESVDAYGKHLFLRFEGSLTLHSHLRMSGAWSVGRSGDRWRRAASRAWLVMRAGDAEVVQFDGPLLELVPDARTRRLGLGPDVLGADFDEARFLALLRRETGTIGDALLNQRVVAGIGNVWKSETCFAARVDPWRDVASVSDDEALALVGFARARMPDAVLAGPGARPDAVYGRSGRPCPRCGARVSSRGQGEHNRVTYWCPGCQLQ